MALPVTGDDKTLGAQDAGRWTLDAGHLDARRWTLDTGCWTPGHLGALILVNLEGFVTTTHTHICMLPFDKALCSASSPGSQPPSLSHSHKFCLRRVITFKPYYGFLYYSFSCLCLLLLLFTRTIR